MLSRLIQCHLCRSLIKITEPVYETTTRRFWQPPEMEAVYTQLIQQALRIKKELYFLGDAMGLDYMTPQWWKLERWNPTDFVEAALKASVESLSGWFNARSPYIGRYKPPNEQIAEALARGSRTDIPYHTHWRKRLFRNVAEPVPVVEKDEQGRSFFYLPKSWICPFEWHLLRHQENPIAQKILRDVQPHLAPTRGTVRYAYLPDDPNTWAFLPHDYCGQHNPYWERGHWETVPMPELVEWYKRRLQTLLADLQYVEAKAQAVREAHYHEVEETGQIIYENGKPVERQRYTDVLVERSPAQIKGNIITTLSNLPAYHARVRIRTGTTNLEATINPIGSASVPQQVAQARLSAIYAYSRKHYAKPRATVEAEIRE
jgi:hypothetical protein